MRSLFNCQLELNFRPSNLKVTTEYYQRYERISRILDKNPGIVKLVHKDLKTVLKRKDPLGRGRKCRYATDTILRILICQILEGESLRGIVIRIDDSSYLREFVRIHNGPMIDFTQLCRLKNAIRPRTWEKINRLLTDSAVEEGLIDGEKLRVDTTAYETNIHWPTDSGLLWDTYRVLSRLVATAREIDPESSGGKRLHLRKVKRLHGRIQRIAVRKKKETRELKKAYNSLIQHIESLLGWIPTLCSRLKEALAKEAYPEREALVVKSLIENMEHFCGLGLRVVDQARRRIFKGENVPNDQKVFSIFEAHTELLKRGKAGKPIEFGHMVLLGQVEGKFIVDYKVFKKRPVEWQVIDLVLQRHREVFEHNPRELSADRGFYQGREKLQELQKEIEVVSIQVKGKRTQEDIHREASKVFKLGQQFRAGIEGSISFLKRALGMSRCLNKGWQHYVSTVGATVFVHNLLILAKSYG